MTIEAVIWDFGGVMTTSPFEAFARFEAERGLPADIIRRTNATNHFENAWAKFERAEIDVEAFDHCSLPNRGARRRGARQGCAAAAVGRFAARDGRGAATGEDKFQDRLHHQQPSRQRIGSNSGRSLYVAEVMALFDHVIESAKIGLRKPDPRIYEMMVRRARRRSRRLASILTISAST